MSKRLFLELGKQICYYNCVKQKTSSLSRVTKIFQDPKLKGKHVIMIGGHVFTARTGKEAVKIFNKVTKDYPGEQPTVTYIPKAESLILVICR